MEVDNPDLSSACFGHPQLQEGELATAGPDKVCATDKINQFGAELRAADTDAEERVMALKSDPRLRSSVSSFARRFNA